MSKECVYIDRSISSPVFPICHSRLLFILQLKLANLCLGFLITPSKPCHTPLDGSLCQVGIQEQAAFPPVIFVRYHGGCISLVGRFPFQRKASISKEGHVSN
jgi:hypothetical protein